MRRVSVAIAIVALAFASLLGALPVLASGSVHHNCSGGTEKTMQTFVAREGAYSGVIGEAIVRQLFPCDNPGSTNASFPVVLPANLQRSGAGIVQLGYMVCGVPAGCGGIPDDGIPHFMYTASDNNAQANAADGWAGGPPIRNHRYRFKIVVLGGAYWQYCIKDITAAGSYNCTIRDATWTGGSSIAWWGTETVNTNASMGPDGSVQYNQISMDWMQYLQVVDQTWYVTTGDVLEKSGNQPSYYQAYTYDANNTNDAMNSYTIEH